MLTRALTVLTLLLLTAAPAAAQDRGTLRLETEPAGAEVHVDGALVGRTPLNFECLVGRYTVRLTHPERLPAEVEVLIRAGATTEKRVTLRRKALLHLDIRPEGAEVLLDGESLGHAPLPPFEVDPGTHDLLVRHPTHERGRQTLQLHAGETRTVKVALLATGLPPAEAPALVAPKPPPPWYGPWAGIALASGLILGGAGGTLVAVDEEAAGWSLVGLGGAALVTGIVFLATTPSDPPPRSTTVGPALLPDGGAGLGVTGAF